jgi:hypothetical protein
MARTSSSQKKTDGPAVVDLTHPDGERHYEATTPLELHNLVSGHGYRITDKKLSLEDAAAALAVNVTGAGTAGAGAAPDAGTTPAAPTTTTGTAS